MREKTKNEHKSPLRYMAIPLWMLIIVVLAVGFIFSLVNQNASLQKALNYPNIVTTTPEYYGVSRTQYTFIHTLASPTPEMESTAEVEISANTPICETLKRTNNGQFVFRMFLQSGMELFRIDDDGSNFCRLTDNTGNDDYPAWSPDGSKIAYVSNVGDYGLYLMDADGNNIQLLHTGGSAYSYPAWSPDGQYLVFQGTFDEVFDIYRLELATGEVINLTNQERLDSMPAYSPDGQFIVFVSDRTFNPFIETNTASQYNSYEVYMMDSNGHNPRRLTVNYHGDSHPSFSPDNMQIVYEMQGVHIMNRDGSNSYKLADGYEPIWLPDGRIAYEYNGIHIILPDGSDDRLITSDVPIFGSGIEEIDYTLPR